MGKQKTITITIKYNPVRYSNGFTMVSGEARSSVTEKFPKALSFDVVAYGNTGPRLPKSLHVYVEGDTKAKEIPMEVIATGDYTFERQNRKVTLQNAVFRLEGEPPVAPEMSKKKGGKPTKATQEEYDLLQRAFLGQEFQAAGVAKPHLKADRIYMALNKYAKYKGLEWLIGTKKEPVYLESRFKTIMDRIPELFDWMRFHPGDTDRMMLHMDEYGEYKDSPFRFVVWGNYIMENELQGDTFISSPELLQRIKQETGTEMLSGDILRCIVNSPGPARFDIDFLKNMAFLTKVRSAEAEAGDILGKLCRCRYTDVMDVVSDVRLSDEQEGAVRGICSMYGNGGVAIVTGGPGTGKTTLLKAVLMTLRNMGVEIEKEVALASPTGKAAKRMEELSGYGAQTIHRLLEVDPELGLGYFMKGPGNRLGHRMLIIDEASMIDAVLFKDILRAISYRCTLVLIGDQNQLESVGPGSVLAEMEKANQRVMKYNLSVNYRQKEGSLILENAVRVLSGDAGMKCDEKTFDVLRIPNQGMLMDAIYGIKGMDVIGDPETAIISYSNENTWLINKEILKELKEKSIKSQKYENRRFYVNEKVIFSSNNYDHMNCKSLLKKDREAGIPCPYYNGEMGYIRSIANSGGEMKVSMTIKCPDKTVKMFPEDYKDLSPAYAITGHKAQGSEYDNVVIFIPRWSNADRSWLYTAITRAKKRVVIISEEEGLEHCVSRKRRVRRTKFLRELALNGLYRFPESIALPDGEDTPIYGHMADPGFRM